MGIKVLSLFDGMSCGRIALERAGIDVDMYYASEIDRNAIKVAQHNYPDTIHLGDVKNWREWELPEIDLVIGGSPCQGFSLAGKQLDFEDPRSNLFFEMVNIIEHYKPKYYLLENVRMRKESEEVITEYMGVNPIEINSALVSAQNRKRLYWTNIDFNGQPTDKKLFLGDILETDDVCSKEESRVFYESELFLNSLKKVNKRVFDLGFSKSGIRPRRNDPRKSGISELGTIHNKDAKSCTLTASHVPKVLNKDGSFRYLSTIECERLQTVPEGYTASVSYPQRYKMLGNGWTVDVIAHIFKGLKEVNI